MKNRIVALLVLAVLWPIMALAQEEPSPPPAPVPELDPYDAAIQDSTLYPGLLNLYEKKGQLLCEIRPDQLEHVYLLFPAIKEGLGQGLLVSGALIWDGWTVAFRRVGQKIQFVHLNTRFRSSTDQQLKTVVEEGYGDSVLAALDIVAEREGGPVLVDLGGVFFQDLGNVASWLGASFGAAYMLDPGRTAWGLIKSFPRNVELDVKLTFATDQLFEMDTVPDSRSVSLAMRYSIVEPPDGTGFRQRIADDRIGNFYSALRDFSMPGDDEPFVRYVDHWALEKANPKADRSPPKQPIVYYIEKSVPFRFRPAVRRGILEWNQAFEKIGIIDAIEVRFQPEDADWDAEDIRYSTVRWTADADFGGFGPSRVDPRTGQIIDADILIQADVVRGYTSMARLFGIHPELAEAQPAEADASNGAGTSGKPRRKAAPLPHPACALASGRASQMALGFLALQVQAAAGQTSITLDEFLDASIKDMVMHEVGHTLGLSHNFKGSSATPLEKLHDKAWTSEHGLSGSVMDYLPINVAPPGTQQGEYFPSTIGPYDEWAIEYAYRPMPQAPTPEDELPELGKIAARSAEPELAFANDEDLYRWAYEDADPYTNAFDLSADPLRWSMQRMELIRGYLTGDLENHVLVDGERFKLLRDSFFYLLIEYYRSMSFASRYVAGYDVTRVHKGQTDKPYLRPLPKAQQREALHFLAETGFDDGLWEGLPAKLLNSLAPETWAHWGTFGAMGPVSFPLQQYMALLRAIQLRRLMSGPILARLQNQELAASDPNDALTLPELFGTLQDAVWSELEPPADPIPGAAYVTRFRRDLQNIHLDMLIELAVDSGGPTLQDAGNLARQDLASIAGRIDEALGRFGASMDRLSLAHLQECRTRIRRALEATLKLELP